MNTVGIFVLKEGHYLENKFTMNCGTKKLITGRVSTNRSGGNLHRTDYSCRRNLYIINTNIHQLQHFQFDSILIILNEIQVKLVISL
jgi:hypothetical protein